VFCGCWICKRTGGCDSRKFAKSKNCRFWFLRKALESENQELDRYFRNVKELTVSMRELGVRLLNFSTFLRTKDSIPELV
jgi:hypothetical protein